MWPEVYTDVDRTRPATDDEAEHCQHCEEPFMEDELTRFMGERRCVDCRFYCPVCGDHVYAEKLFCNAPECAYAAMGVEV